jgi:uncharacterized membrane protein (DUF485 family)
MSDADALAKRLDYAYNAFEGDERMRAFLERHNIRSAAVLTVYDDETAAAICDYLAPRIEGKTVVEIGGGIGLLALHMGFIAKRVYCIEANPLWSSSFIAALIGKKPKNVSYLFGAADEFVGAIKGDVALYCTHSDAIGMGLVAAQFAPAVIDVWGDIIALNPDRHDPLARALRPLPVMPRPPGEAP